MRRKYLAEDSLANIQPRFRGGTKFPKGPKDKLEILLAMLFPDHGVEEAS